MLFMPRPGGTYGSVDMGCCATLVGCSMSIKKFNRPVTMPKSNQINRWEDPDSIRWYSTPLGDLRSVTSYLKALNKPALINWAARTTAEFFKDKLEDIKGGILDIEEMDINEIVFAAKQYHKEKLGTAGQRGTNVHHAIDDYYKTGKRPEEDGETKILFESFLGWEKDYNVIAKANEMTVYTDNYAGTLDLICDIDYCPESSEGTHGVYVNDFKTGKAIYPEAGLQVAAYLYAYRKMRPAFRVDGAMITRLFSGGHEVKVYTNFQCALLFEAFECLVRHVNIMEKFNKRGAND